MVARKDATSKAGSPSSLKTETAVRPAANATGNNSPAVDNNANIPAESRPGVSKTAQPVRDTVKNNGGGAGPASSLKTKSASLDGRVQADSKALNYSVQIHSDEKGLEVFEPISAESGDEAAQKALAKKNYRGASVRGVQPYSDPDANSLGGERDAGIMYANAENGGNIVNTIGTEANREATEKLGKADVTELGE